MGFYNHQTGRYQLYSDAERRAYGERMRDKASEQWNKIWITKTGLKTERNWTDWAINHFLKRLRPKEFNGRYQTYFAFRRESILKVENKEEFVDWMKKRVEKQNAKRV